MPDPELRQLRLKAFENVTGADYYSRAQSEHNTFARVLGFSDYRTYLDSHVSGDRALHEKLKLLAGPHGRTIYKAMRARREHA